MSSVTETSQQSLPKTTPPKKMRRPRARLYRLPEMPLDILFEILQHLRPLDLLNLARTTKSFRKILMSRSSAWIWKAARESLELPDCPPYMSEPKYANLWFDNHCNNCLKSNIKEVCWEFRARYCGKCKQEMATQDYDHAADLPSIRNVASIGRRVRLVNWHHKDDVERYLALLHAAETPEQKSQVILDQQVLTLGIMEHTTKCKQWLENAKRSRQMDLDLIRERRRIAIIERLTEMGWGEEISLLGSKFHRLSLVRRPQDLTERIWKRARPLLIKYLESQKTERMHSTFGSRFNTLQIVINKGTAGRYPNAIILPHAVDLCMDMHVRDLLDLPTTFNIGVEWVATYLVHLLPEMINDWQQDKILELSNLFLSFCGLSIDPTVNSLQLAVVVFRCSLCPESSQSFHYYPDVMKHGCLTKSRPPIAADDYYETISISTFNRSPWSCAGLEVGRWVERAKAVIEAFGLDPGQVTSAQMDTLDPKFACRFCMDPLEFMSWRAAVDHSLKTHLDQDPSSLWEYITVQEEQQSKLALMNWALQRHESVTSLQPQSPFECSPSVPFDDFDWDLY